MSTGADTAVPAGKLRSVVTYLAMTAPPRQAPPPAAASGIAIRRWRIMPAADYLRLYRRIGDPWLWWSRLTMDEPTLAAQLAAPETEIYVAEADGEPVGEMVGEPVGFAELDLRPAPDIEVRYLGVVPSRIGTGLGGCLLVHALAAAWRHRPRRVILNTCDYDHPGALDFYRRYGFAVTHSEVQIIDDPRLIGLLPLSAGPHVPLARPAEG